MAIPGVMLLDAIWQENQLTQEWVQQVEQPALQSRAAPPRAVASTTKSPTSKPQAQRPSSSPVRAPQIAFAIRVPRLNYFAAVRQGISLDVLFAGPGHYPATAMPGEQGNVGIAAHNTYWIAFGVLKPGDIVILETRNGSYTYKIYGSQIVSPNNTTVLAPTQDHRLTLTTCWPLWAGALATQRLVFLAEEVNT
ncbi:MAG TPA: class D sortase [Candidatus Dormibacteraeota bacterium]